MTARTLAVLLALAWLLALPAVWARAAAERQERAVELVVDHAAVDALARARGLDAGSLLAAFARAGATSAGLREASLLRLRAAGRIELLDGAEAERVFHLLAPAGPRAAVPVRDGWTYAAGDDPELGAWLAEAWTALYRQGWPAEPPRLLTAGGRWLLAVPAPYAHAKLAPLGYEPAAVRAVRAAGLLPVPVLRDPPPLPGLSLAAVLAGWERAGLDWHLVIVDADPAPGYPEGVDQTGAFLAARGAALGLVERWDQLGYLARRGSRELLAAAGGRAVRVYAIQPDLHVRLTPEERLDRIVTSVLERRLRAVWVQPLSPRVVADPVASSPAHVRELARRLRAAGLEVGRAVPFPGLVPPRATYPAALAATALALALLALRAGLRLGLRPGLVRAAAVAGAGAMALAALLRPEVEARQVAAFAAAVAFPLIGVDAATAVADRAGAAGSRGPRAAPAGLAALVGGATAPAGVAAATAGTAVALAGGLLVAALLAGEPFQLVWAYFRGVKASFALPALLLALALVAEFGAAPRREGGRRVLLVAAALGLLLVGAAVARTAAFAEAPAWEVAARRALAEWLLVRPRFKEFLVGVPALVMLGALAPRPGRLARIALALAALVGLTSVVNSFAHVFTPVAVSLWRTANGLLLGLPLGLLAAAAWRRAAAGRRRTPAPGR